MAIIRLIHKIVNLPPFSWINIFRKQIVDKKLYKLRAPYFVEIEKYLDKDTSIISSNCFAGRIMQDIGMQYNTPTLGLWIMPDDFPRFCANLKHYMSVDPIQVDHSKNALGEAMHSNPSSNHDYPIGKVDDVEIHFLHYHSAQEAFSKWKRRAGRVNYNKLFIIGMEQNGCTEEDIKAFDSIPFIGKVFFSSKPYPYRSVIYIPEFSNLGCVGDPYKKGHVFYRYLVEWFKRSN